MPCTPSAMVRPESQSTTETAAYLSSGEKAERLHRLGRAGKYGDPDDDGCEQPHGGALRGAQDSRPPPAVLQCAGRVERDGGESPEAPDSSRQPERVARSGDRSAVAPGGFRARSKLGAQAYRGIRRDGLELERLRLHIQRHPRPETSQATIVARPKRVMEVSGIKPVVPRRCSAPSPWE